MPWYTHKLLQLCLVEKYYGTSKIFSYIVRPKKKNNRYLTSYTINRYKLLSYEHGTSRLLTNFSNFYKNHISFVLFNTSFQYSNHLSDLHSNCVSIHNCEKPYIYNVIVFQNQFGQCQ